MKNKLSELRKEILRSQKIENKNIKSILKWLKKRDKVNNMKVRKTSVNELKDWYFKKNGNLFHKSGQFFSVEGVKVKNAVERETSSWSQPILNQKHGGILAILTRTNKDIVERLTCIEARLPNGELEEMHTMIKEIKEILLDPEDGIIVRVNKNTYWRKELDADEFKALLRWKQSVTHAMWLVYSAVLGILVKLIFF